ncbi:MAG TPA: redoxin domain-containing protein [Alphaproteobacteria bacterium]|nr:redoxin domain-containing protein [Alphaproteobacteria bacterium]
MHLVPNRPAPALTFPMLSGKPFDLARRRPRSFTQIIVYRGLHCPICKSYLKGFDARFSEFEERGVETVAVSTDTREAAEQSVASWGLERLPVGYGLAIETARSWGLYISSAIREEEPPLFAEPGLFLVHPDARLYWATAQSMPFTRPSVSDLLQALDFILAKKYPARGAA